MGVLEIIFIGAGLAMDAFVVSVCKGTELKKDFNNFLVVASYFGIFQGLMPLIGYYLGINFQSLIMNIDHWIAFFLLSFIGIKMIIEAYGNNSEKIDDKLDFNTMIMLSIATSIDALVVGITFAFLNVNIFLAVFIIGIVTFVLTYIGVIFGNKFGNKFGIKAEIFGGIILIIIGIKILLEHLGVI